MAAYVPPGWPAGVHPPGSEDFERTAQAWLLDVVPPDYRLHGVLRRYPLALAAMAAHHAEACVVGAREAYRNARTDVGGALPPHALEALLAAYRAEGRRLVATAQAVHLVARALRGEVFTPQLEDTAQRGTGGPAAGAEAERQAAQRPSPDQPAAEPAAGQSTAEPPAAGRAATQQPARLPVVRLLTARPRVPLLAGPATVAGLPVAPPRRPLRAPPCRAARCPRVAG